MDKEIISNPEPCSAARSGKWNKAQHEIIVELEGENLRLRTALEMLRDGTHIGTPINPGCGAMRLIEEALSTNIERSDRRQ